MWVCWVSNKNILTVVWDVLPVIPALKLDSERKKHKNINTDSHIPRYELIREGIWFSEHKQVGLRKELAALMQDDRCVFGLSLSRRGILQEGGRVYLNLYSPSGEKKTGCQWLWWVISSQGKPRSQWVWPTAAHLEPMRQAEDLLREGEGERDMEEEKWVRQGFLIVPSAINLLSPLDFNSAAHVFSPRAQVSSWPCNRSTSAPAHSFPQPV